MVYKINKKRIIIIFSLMIIEIIFIGLTLRSYQNKPSENTLVLKENNIDCFNIDGIEVDEEVFYENGSYTVIFNESIICK